MNMYELSKHIEILRDMIVALQSRVYALEQEAEEAQGEH